MDQNHKHAQFVFCSSVVTWSAIVPVPLLRCLPFAEKFVEEEFLRFMLPLFRFNHKDLPSYCFMSGVTCFFLSKYLTISWIVTLALLNSL